MRFYVTERIGKTRSRTPDGFLLIEAVPIARTGVMLYGPGELDPEITPGPDGIVRVERTADEVFKAESMASLEGKPLTDDHPPGMVTPENWRDLARGVVLNARRGAGIADDILLGDILVQDQEAIDAIEGGKKQLSCGYDADYEMDPDMPGFARQLNIIHNHVALVDQGRCGPRCAIGDRQQGESDMFTRDKRQTIWDRMMAAFKAKDEAGFVKAMEEGKNAKDALGEGDDLTPEGGGAGEGNEVHVHLHGGKPGADDPAATEANRGDPVAAALQKIDQRLGGIEERLTKLEGGGEEGAGEGEGGGDDDLTGDAELELQAGQLPAGATHDGKKKAKTADEKKGDKGKKQTRDSSALEPAFGDLSAKAEILLPGVRLPTFDKAVPLVETIDSFCQFRRSVLAKAYKTEDVKAAVDSLTGGSDFAKVLPKMTCDGVLTLFNGAAAIIGRETADASAGSGKTGKFKATDRKTTTIADVNKRNREFWKQA